MDFDEAVTFLARKLPETPSVFIVYTNALGNFPVAIESPIKFSCHEIPHFPPKKEGQGPIYLIYGKVFDIHIMVLQGRYHHYEGYTQDEIMFPVKVARCLGCKRMLAINAAGSLTDRFELGDVMLMKSHVDLSGLRDKREQFFSYGKRELEKNAKMYNDDFLRTANKLATEEGMDKYVKTGVYGLIGDCIPTNYSEIYNWKKLGIDAVGTSLTPEVLTAFELGMEISCISILTDKGILEYNQYPDPLLEDISKAVEPKKAFVKKLILRFIITPLCSS